MSDWSFSQHILVPTKMVYLQCSLAITWLVPCGTAAILACSVYTSQPCTMSPHFMQCHIHKVHACLAVTCHLHFWQNDQEFLHATAITQGGMDTEIRVSSES